MDTKSTDSIQSDDPFELYKTALLSEQSAGLKRSILFCASVWVASFIGAGYFLFDAIFSMLHQGADSELLSQQFLQPIFLASLLVILLVVMARLIAFKSGRLRALRVILPNRGGLQ